MKFLNAYVDGFNQGGHTLKIAISRYGCCGIDDPGLAACMQSDSSSCEFFTATGTQGGVIEVLEPAYVSYSGDLTGSAYPNRFYWMYYKLYDDANNNMLPRVMSQAFASHCPGPQLNSEKIKMALDDACKHYVSLFKEDPQYVQCEYQIYCMGCGDGSCSADTASCLDFDCERPAFSESLCWEGGVSVAGKGQLSTGEKISYQGGTVGSVNVRFSIKDTKYKISSSLGSKPVVWNIWAAIQIAQRQCRPIDQNQIS
jgi:hypothetical protein